MFLSSNIIEPDWWGLPAWGVMWLLAVGIFAICKILTWRVEHRSLSSGAAVAYLLGWPGLNPLPFSRRAQLVGGVPADKWIRASARTALGVVLIAVAIDLRPEGRPLLSGWIGMIGLVFLLHFGTFDLLACLWRHVGYDVQPLMESPHRSTSLIEFWSHRWNRAFRDLSHRLVLRPLRGRLGPTGAMCAVFLISGLIHDLVISVPARGGYGLPSAYFLLQAVGVVLQRTTWMKRAGLNSGVRGWFVTALWLIVPLPLLFHEPFVIRVILPFLDALRNVVS